MITEFYKVSKNYYKTNEDKKHNKPYAVDLMAAFKSEEEALLYKYNCEFHDFDNMLNSDEPYDYSVKKLRLDEYVCSNKNEYKNYIVECVFNIEANYFCDEYNVLGFMINEIKEKDISKYTIDKIYQDDKYMRYNFTGEYPFGVKLKDVFDGIKKSVKEIANTKYKDYKIDKVEFIKNLDEIEEDHAIRI